MIPRSDAELDKLHQANAITVETLDLLARAVEPGVTTAHLDRVAAGNLKRHGVTPAFKGYHGFPATLCVSINDEVVHGIPSRWRKLREGDIVSLDFGCIVDGYYGDNATTVPVGRIDKEIARLLEVTEQALYAGIGAARSGNCISDIGQAVQNHAESHGFSIVREYGGHGIGTSLHAEPWIPNYYDPGKRIRLIPGAVIAIEPMVNRGNPGVRVKRDRWTVVTLDGSQSAHFERSIAVTDGDPWVLAEPKTESRTPESSTPESRIEDRGIPGSEDDHV